MVTRTDERSGYTLGPDLPYTPLSIMAARLKTSSPRLSRLLVNQKIPVHRMGFVILVNTKDRQKIVELLAKKSGRKTRVRRPL